MPPRRARKEEAPPKRAAKKPARTRKAAAPLQSAVDEEQEQLEQEDAEEQFEAPGSTPVHEEQVVASDHEEPVEDEPTQEEPAEQTPDAPLEEEPVQEEPEPDPVPAEEEPVEDKDEPSVAEKEPEEDEVKPVAVAGSNAPDYDQQVKEAYFEVVSAANVAVKGEQQTDDLRRRLGMALYDLFYAVFTTAEVAHMRHEVKNGQPLSFPIRAARVLRDLGLPPAHFRSNNPISGWYAAVYFKAKEALAREIEGRNKAGAKIIPFGVGVIGKSDFETSYWNRDEVAQVQKGNRLQIAEPQPHRIKGSNGETLLSPQTEEAIAGDIYRYSRLTFLAIDIRDRSVLTMSFPAAEALWLKFKSEGLDTLGVPPKIRAPATPGTGRGRGRPKGSTNANTSAVLAAARAASAQSLGLAGGTTTATTTPPTATPPEPEEAGTWRAVGEGELFPPGKKFRMNVTTGINEVFEPDDEGTPATTVPTTAPATSGITPRPRDGAAATSTPQTTTPPAGQQQAATTVPPTTTTPASSSGITPRPRDGDPATSTPQTTTPPAGQQPATSVPPTTTPAATASGITPRPRDGEAATPTEQETPPADAVKAQDGVIAVGGPTEAEEENGSVEASQEESSTPAAEEENGSTALTVIPPSTALTLIPESVAAKFRQGQAIVTRQETVLVPAEYEPIPDIAPIDWQIDNREWLDSLPEESHQTVRMVKHDDGTVTCTLLRIVSTPLLAASS